MPRYELVEGEKIVELVFSNSFLILSFIGRIVLSFRLVYYSVFQEERHSEGARNEGSEHGWMDGMDR